MASDPHAPRPDPVAGLFDFKSMFDAMEVARRNWSAMPIPSVMTPTIDPAELDKRIADLKTVEQWLVLNLNLLRGSIQALELQRATLSSLHSFGEAARAAAEAATQAETAPQSDSSGSPPRPPDAGSAASADAPSIRRTDAIDPTAWWHTLQAQFQQVAESALAGLTPAAPGPAAASPPTAATGRPGRSARSASDEAPRPPGRRKAPAAATSATTRRGQRQPR